MESVQGVLSAPSLIYPSRSGLQGFKWCLPEAYWGLEKDMSDLCPAQKDFKSFPRDSGYDSLPSKLSVLDKLLHTHPVWLQLGLNDAETAEVLQTQPPGTFLVRKSTRMQKKVLSLRLPTTDLGSCLKEFAIKESAYSK
uniref:E3 ubiquitin protein ligase rin2 n=1 Tax=Sphaerodactylus townsendi TaxID=933632 RepID=A0ACB8ECD6_9SAUR